MGAILEPLYDLVSFIIKVIYDGLTAIGLNPNSGLTWSLSIIGLVLVVRAAMIPLFVKQIKASRDMMVLQPKIRELQKKYKNDRERLTQETMKLYKEHGTNPFQSCLPILIQAPFFLALYHVLAGIAKGQATGVLTQSMVDHAQNATVFGAPISAHFLGSSDINVKIVAGTMIVLMSLSQFFTQRQLMTKNMPADAAENNPYLQQQKILMYIFPLFFAVAGVNFPVGVLLYWLTTNIWTMCQQLVVIRHMPTPGSTAHAAQQERQAAKARKAGEVTGDEQAVINGVDGTEVVKPIVARNQPQRTSRSKRTGSSGKKK